MRATPDPRDRDADPRDRDPLDVFLYALDLPRGDERELVIDGDARYELVGEDARWLATVGAFRVVPERDVLETREVARTPASFCSHLAMRGAPARAIQELAGHTDLSTTQRYTHLSPAALDRAIRLLDGDMLETRVGSAAKSTM